MAYATYNQIPGKIKDREPFQGSSVRATADDGEFYIIFSYRTIMMIIHLKSDEIIYFDNTSHSPTTSRLQNMVGYLMRDRYSIPYTPYRRDNQKYYRRPGLRGSETLTSSDDIDTIQLMDLWRNRVETKNPAKDLLENLSARMADISTSLR